ncbi:MAG TPA: DUF1559 domain-containing protein [Pirellulales bacterium]
MSRWCLVIMECLLLSAAGGCGKTQPAASQVALAPTEQTTAGAVVYQHTGPATFGGASGIPGPVGAALPQSNGDPTASGVAATTGTTAIGPAGPVGAPAGPGPMPTGPTMTASTAGAPAPPLSPQTPAPTVATAQPPVTAAATTNPPAVASNIPATPSPASAPSATPSGPASAVGSGNVAALAAAVNQWRAQGANLVGVTRKDDKPVLAGYSWMVHLLPYVGHDDLHKKFDFAKGWHEKENLALACQEIPAFLDPMNGSRHMTIVGQKNAIGPAFTHYVGMAGVEDSRNLVAAELPRSDNRAGIFGYNEIARQEQITDGISNTVMLISAGKIVGPWASGGGATVRGARAPYFDDITGFSSGGDPGAGALAAMADGSVKRISKEIDPAVFRAMCTMHGAESIDLSAHGNVIRPQ